MPALAEPTAVAEAQGRAGSGAADAEAAGEPDTEHETERPAADVDGAGGDAATDGSLFPTDDPTAEEGQRSETPRLDALLGDQR